MRQVTNESTVEVIRMRLHLLRNLYSSSMRSGEEHLLAAMAEYEKSFRPSPESDPA